MVHRAADMTLLALLERTSRLIQGLLHAESLPPAQWLALQYLARANRFSRTPTAVGLYLEATKGTVSQSLIALVRKGLVRKERDRTDRRSVSMHLTARGESALNRDPLSDLSTAAAALPRQTQDGLSRGLADLLKIMLAKKGGHSFGQCSTCRYFQRQGEPDDPRRPHRCALLKVPLSDDDASKICVEHEYAA
jgi:DNA-binding MarR family transcriptional regulator